MPNYEPLEISDSASATSSTLVVTPSGFTKQQSLKLPQFQPPHLQLLQPGSVDMLKSQGTGKGPIQPHISNLPRRKPRGAGLASPSPVRPAAAKNSLSSASIRTNGGRSPSRSVSPPGPSSSSSSSSSSPPLSHKQAHFIDDEPSPSVAAGLNLNVKPAPALELSYALPSSKGHIQPHVTNMPRRRVKQPTPMSAREIRERQEKEAGEKWEKARCLQQAFRGVWIGFWDWDRDSDRKGKAKDQDDSDSDSNANGTEGAADPSSVCHSLFMEEFMCAERVVRILPHHADLRSNTPSAMDSSTDAVTEEILQEVSEETSILSLFIPRHSTQRRDDGVPHLSAKQVSAVRDFLSHLSESTFSASSIPPVVTPFESKSSSNSFTPMAGLTALSTPSLSRSTSSSTSTSPFPFSSPPSSYPSSYSQSRSESRLSVAKPLLITVPSREYAVDALALAILAKSLIVPDLNPTLTPTSESAAPSDSDSDSPSPSPTLDTLVRLHDLEDLALAWRGALSCDGVEWLDEVVFGIKRRGIDIES